MKIDLEFKDRTKTSAWYYKTARELLDRGEISAAVKWQEKAAHVSKIVRIRYFDSSPLSNTGE